MSSIGYWACSLGSPGILKFGPFAVINADDYYGSATPIRLIRTFGVDSNEGELAAPWLGFDSGKPSITVRCPEICVQDDYLTPSKNGLKSETSTFGIDSSGKNGELTGEEIVSLTYGHSHQQSSSS